MTAATEAVDGVPEWAAEALGSGRLDAGWAGVLAAVPRAAFLPDVIWPKDPADGKNLLIDRRDDPDGWREWAGRDVPIVTQWDDRPDPRLPGTTATSSASQPSLVVDMLADLDVHPGHRVLDAGTGTGWTTGLLAARAGAGRVAGIEFDAAVADAARRRLRKLGLDPLVVTGDGAAGRPEVAPYDRVQCTYAVRRIPAAWVEQTRPDGVIVAPWRTRLTHHGAIARLTVGADGTASGRFTRSVRFMGSRPEREPWIDPDDYHPGDDWPPGTAESTTALRPADLWDTPYNPAWWTAGLLVPDAVHTTTSQADGTLISWLYSVRCRSWAITFFDGDPAAEVYQGGPRRLWDEIEHAYRWWNEHGKPVHENFGLATGPHRETAWLHRPDNPLPPPPPTDQQ